MALPGPFCINQVFAVECSPSALPRLIVAAYCRGAKQEDLSALRGLVDPRFLQDLSCALLDLRRYLRKVSDLRRCDYHEHATAETCEGTTSNKRRRG